MAIHKPVLLKETIENLNLKKGVVVVDATLGGGGHSHEILKKIGEEGMLIGIDADKKAIENFFAKVSDNKMQISNFVYRPTGEGQIPIFKFKNIILVNANFVELDKILEILKIEKANAILADLGWSSDQLEGKGISFQKDENLDMRISTGKPKNHKAADKSKELTAKYLVNNYSEKDLGEIIRELGEEKFWKNITRKIIEYRKSKRIETTRELVEIIKNAVPKKYQGSRINPATRTFQALRIVVNQELSNLEKFIPQSINVLEKEGRLVIISFHSLEDRIVKKTFVENARGRVFTDEITGQKKMKSAPTIKIITKKPITPTEKEIGENPKSRSAKLRVAEKI